MQQVKTNGKKENYVTLPLLERPRPTWVLPSEKETIPGRKFYVHHNGWKSVLDGVKLGEDRNVRITPSPNNSSFQVMAQDQKFQFEIKMKNLREWELGLLIYTLELEPGLAHKLGRGKPLGFGSVAVQVDEMHRRRDSGSWEIWSDESLVAKKAALKKIGWDELKTNLLKIKDPGIEPEHITRLRRLLQIPQADCMVYYPSLDEYRRLKDSFYGPNAELKKPWSLLP